MATNIYFVRHGKVENKKNIFYGRLPGIKLSEEGKKQVEEAAHFLKEKNIKKIFSSTLLRARQSAYIISAVIGSKNISRTNLITDIDSYMEGKPFEYGRSSKFDHYFSPLRKPGNETMEAVLKRMLKFIKKAAKKYPNQNIAVIAHGDPLMILKAHIEGSPMILDSIRPGMDKFVKYGEVYLVRNNEKKITIKNLFSPET